MHWLERIDSEGVEVFAALRNGPMDAVAQALSSTGLRLVLLALLLGLVVWYTRRALPALVGLGAVLVTDLTVTLLKLVFSRDRPPVGDSGLTALIELPDSASLPSGHAAGAMCAAVALGAFLPRTLRWTAVAVAALIGLSRVWLGVHFPGDVVIGAAVGAIMGLLAVRLVRHLETRLDRVVVAEGDEPGAAIAPAQDDPDLPLGQGPAPRGAERDEPAGEDVVDPETAVGPRR
jgi:membrane-associated phospholipid phosphatase